MGSVPGAGNKVVRLDGSMQFAGRPSMFMFPLIYYSHNIFRRQNEKCRLRHKLWRAPIWIALKTQARYLVVNKDVINKLNFIYGGRLRLN